MEEIEEWFRSGKPYAPGLILLAKYAKNKSICAAFPKNRENSTLKRDLELQLRRIANRNKTNTHTVTEVTTKETTGKVIPKKSKLAVISDPCDALLHEIQEKANKIYIEMAVTQNRILATKEQKGRKKLYTIFITQQLEWAKWVYKRDYLKENGSLPAEEKRKITKANSLPGNLHSELVLLRSKVTRAINEQIPFYKTKSGKKWEAKLKAREADVEKWKSRITELETGLGNG